MKKTIIALALVLSTLTLSAKEVVKNTSTGAVLNETAGIYSITGFKTGAIILGDAKSAASLLTTLDGCFAKEGIEKLFKADLGKDYEVHQDKDGHWYIICLKAGGAKLYPSDVNLFLAAIGGKSLVKGIGKAGEWVSKKAEEINK